jgi:hypothetical protein
MEVAPVSWQLQGIVTDIYLCTERYFDLLKEAKVRGYLFQQQNYVPKE